MHACLYVYAHGWKGAMQCILIVLSRYVQAVYSASPHPPCCFVYSSSVYSMLLEIPELMQVGLAVENKAGTEAGSRYPERQGAKCKCLCTRCPLKLKFRYARQLSLDGR
eukprot:scaffold57494_cov19-Tisochrysis_lutea.AAC.1